MKKIIIFILLTGSFFILSCFNDPEVEIPWIETMIQSAEDGSDLTYTVAIWSYEYYGELVYYTLSSSGEKYNSVYDSSGNYLGAPDGGWLNTGDSSLVDFFEAASNKILVWTYDFPDIEGINDEYEVLNSVLRSRWPGQTYLHVVNQTSGLSQTFPYWDLVDESGITCDSSLVSEYLFRNSLPLTLNQDYLLSTIVLYSSTQRDYLFEEYSYPENWNEYYRRYPNSNGIIEISRAGFSNNGNYALLTLDWQITGEGTYGYLYVMEKVNGQWLVRWQLTT